MNIFFKKNTQINEITVTVEKNNRDREVGNLLSYLNDYEQYANVLTVEKESQIYKFPFTEILWIEVIGDYTSIYTNTIQLRVRKTLQSIESELPNNKFIRTSRNTLVNIKKIKKVESSFSGTMSAILLNNQTIHISRKYWKNIKKRILDND
ncbi:TPA: LytTR family DNA-binding domain-containing protein [Enterococcus faecium]|nr:LytTR family DNA-binding domain-containing protein [Enterococcus faecium]MDN3045672.1 LytTR family DNA-binding domain-containing protein [Enterococcus faecium]MDQ8216053.1 LytTR family DNA-binding domain-containing protein [Enterococcus faecium]MDQ8218466.1 LytTR family DNA-binding domain-containing protein [Enterococcus faecium]MDQ8221060.1 LytTR family DNA-binding domain-containing protein [Enterococcus faecium]MDQ8260330.1 LytTR family DNA-binding domain-containing protein [Enterococcus 